MDDYKSLPAWKRGMTLAHALYAAVDGAGLKESEEGRRLRKAAVAVPSLIAEAFMDLTGRDPEDALFVADSKIAEASRLLGHEAMKAIPADDRASLLAGLSLLSQELEELKASRVRSGLPS